MNTKAEPYLIQLTNYYAAIDATLIPHEVWCKARRVLVDFLSVMAVGRCRGDLTPIIINYISHLSGNPESTILFADNQINKVPAIHAALVMGIMAHSVELDDGYRFGTCHPSVAIIPSVLAVAERNKKSFKDIISSIIVGYDIMLRLAASINPSHLHRGFHTTGTCGSIGSAAAVAFLQKFNSLQMAYSISIAGLQSAGIQEMLHDNPSIKPLQAGKAAYHGVLSCDLVMGGAKAPRTLFEGQHGWLKAMCDDWNPSILIDNLGEKWHIINSYTKLYPTCRHCHPSIDLAIDIKNNNLIKLKDIEHIIIKTYNVAFSEVCLKKKPKTHDEAMFSLPFSVALALRDGKVIIESYSDGNLFDKDLNDCIDKMQIDVDEDMNNKYPNERGSTIHLKLYDGRCIVKTTSLPRGEPETPLHDRELFEKIKNIMLPYYDNKKIQKLWDFCVETDINDVNYGDIVTLFKSGD
jgi:2-methylcitrate dehydratase PrpD